MLFFYLIFLNLFLCLWSLVDETHLWNCGYSKQMVIGTSRGPQVAVILTCSPRPVEQVFTNSQSRPDFNTGSQTKSSAAAGATCGRPVYSNENLFFLQHGGLQKVCCLYGALSPLRAIFTRCLSPLPPPVLPQSEHMDSHPQLKKWQMILFVCFICGSKLGPQFRCTPSIYHVNTLFISLFIYLFIYLFI